MATLDQIGDALRKADAAGNVDDARRLATAYKAMQGQQPQAPVYDAAGQRAVPAEQSSNIEDRTIGRPNLINSTEATVNGLVSAVPFLQQGSDAIIGAAGMLAGKDYGETVRGLQDRRAEIAKAAPVARGAGDLVGTVAAVGALPERAGASLVAKLADASLGTAGYEGAQALAHGKAGTDALIQMGEGAAGGAAGALAGAGVEKLGGKIAETLTSAAQKKLTNAAIKNAPDASELAAAGSDLFKAVDAAGVRVDIPKFSGVVQRLASDAKKMRINPTLDLKSHAAYTDLIHALGDVQKSGSMTVSDLHTLRQIAQKAAISSDGRDSFFAKRIIKSLDDFVTTPGATAGGGAGGKELMDAIGLWRQSAKTGHIEEAIYRAGNAASGLENGLRVEFRKLLQNRELRSQFAPHELKEISAVANGTATSNLVRLIGKFGFGHGSAGNMLGGTIGFGAGSALGGPIAGIAAALLASGARKASEKIAKTGAERVARVVATPNIPIAAASKNMLSDLRRPVDILVRGGSLSALAPTSH